MIGHRYQAIILMVSSWVVLSLVFTGNACASSAEASPGYVYGLNGNQEILGDPSRPIIYYADRDAGSVVIWNFSSDVRTTLSIGGRPICLDLGVDGDLLYVAVAGGESIVVVDIDGLAVERTIPLGFTPASLAVRSSGELYVSSANDTMVRAVNLTSDEISVSFDAGYTAILSAQVGGDQLLASAIWQPDGHVNITRYSLTPTPHIVANKDMGTGVTAQVAVDWEDGAVYVAANGLGGFQKRSLSDLELVASYSEWRDLNGIALSNDAKTVFAICTANYWDLPGGQQLERWGSMIYLLDAQSFELLAMKFVSGERGAICTSTDQSSVFIGSPLERVGVAMSVAPVAPAADSVYAYTPSYVEFTFGGDLIPAFSPWVVQISLDGYGINVTQMPSADYRGLIDNPMVDGFHQVAVNISGSVHGWWNFTIDPESPSAIVPVMNLTSPAPGSHVHELPGSVAVSYQLSVPEPLSPQIELFFNGIPMTEYTQEWYPGTVFGYVPYDGLMSYGVYTVNASMSWLGGSHVYSWSFTWQQDPYLNYNYPGSGSILPSSPSHVEAVLFLGRPHVTIESVEVAIDNVSYPYYLGMLDQDEMFLGANLSSPLQPGWHHVHVGVNTSLGLLEADWDFTVDSLAIRQYKQDFRIPVPATWMYSKDVEVQGTKADLSAFGPELNGVTTNLIVQSEVNWTLLEDSSTLLGLPDTVVAGLQSAGIRCGIMETPSIVTISSHIAVQYSIQWYDLPLVQRQVILVNQDSHRYWIMTFTVYDGQYFWLDPLFDAIEDGFTLLPGGNQTKLTDYDYWGEFTIPVPDTWATVENQTFGGQQVSLIARGPVLDGFRPDLVVMSERNGSVRSDRPYLEGQVQATIEVLAEGGVDVTLRGEEVFTNISGVPAMIFALDWVGQPITEKVAILADEGSHTIWVVTCGSSTSTYGLLEPSFDSIIAGLVVHPMVWERPPGPPSGLHLEAGDRRITINWTTPRDCGTSNITGYEVYRGNASGSLTYLTTLGENSTSFNDTGLQNAQVYYYKVRAVSPAGQGNFTDIAAATPIAPPPSGGVDGALFVGVVAVVTIMGIGTGVVLARRRK